MEILNPVEATTEVTGDAVTSDAVTSDAVTSDAVTSDAVSEVSSELVTSEPVTSEGEKIFYQATLYRNLHDVSPFTLKGQTLRGVIAQIWADAPLAASFASYQGGSVVVQRRVVGGVTSETVVSEAVAPKNVQGGEATQSLDHQTLGQSSSQMPSGLAARIERDPDDPEAFSINLAGLGPAAIDRLLQGLPGGFVKMAPDHRIGENQGDENPGGEPQWGHRYGEPDSKGRVTVPPDLYSRVEGKSKSEARTLLLAQDVPLHWTPQQPYLYFAIDGERELIVQARHLDDLVGLLHQMGCSRVDLEDFQIYACLRRRASRQGLPQKGSSQQDVSHQGSSRPDSLLPGHIAQWLQASPLFTALLEKGVPQEDDIQDDDIVAVHWREYLDCSEFDAVSYDYTIPGVPSTARTCPCGGDHLPPRQPRGEVGLLPTEAVSRHSSSADGLRWPEL